MLPSLTAAFLFGLFCGSQFPFFPVALSGLLAGLALGSSLLERAGIIESNRALWLYGALLSGVLYWSILIPPIHPDPSPPDRRDIRHIEITGRIVAPVQHGPDRQTILIEFQEAHSESRRMRLVWRQPDDILYQGDLVSFQARPHPPIGSLNPGGFNYAVYLERQGISLTATVIGGHAVRIVESGEETWRWMVWNRIDRWRAMIRNAAVNTLSQPSLGIFLGIIIGERGFLQQDLQEWFMATGTVHLLSISGSHLGLVTLVVFWISRQAILRFPPRLLLELSRTMTPTKIAILVTWPVVALYAVLAGAELATIRSLVMITLALAALWLGQERRAYHAMAAAALIILLHDPRALFDISFQLSFLSVLMIINTVQWLEGWNRDRVIAERTRTQTIARYGWDAFLMSAGVTVTTLPVVAVYFNQVPWMGVVTNLLAVPFTGILLVPLGLIAAAWTVVAGTGDLMIGTILEQLLVWMVQGLRWCADIPGGVWHIAAPSVPAIVVFYTGLIMVSIGRIPRYFRILGAGIALFFVCWWVTSPRIGPDGDHWRVTFLDVGQGDSAVIELPDGQTVLIDGGARYERFDMGRGVVAPFLWNRGITHLDHVIGTHDQLDHVGGLIWVLRHIPVGRYWANGVHRSEQFSLDLDAVLNENQISQHIATRGQELLPSGPCKLTILNPPEGANVDRAIQRSSGTFLNNQSIVSRVQCGVHAILFAADIEVDGLRRLGDEGRRPVTVLKVPHHGARSSLDREWLGQIRPQYAVISVGRTNPYGHPVPDVLDAYADEDIHVFRTDYDGAIWITGRMSTSEMTVARMRDVLLHPVVPRRCLWRCEQENWRRLWLQFPDRPDLPFI
ncbi:MAG: DNA internalization-related competence protein ComEC/Rec2 [Nitrospira sp.]|nr:DNA internalization-related competence protein ComEC/Rec2 [Nitrospira sp.]